MKVAFPHMGDLHIVLKSIFTSVGLEVCIPPLPSQETLRLGARYAPECSCLPFKIILGNYLQALEGGADTLLMLGGCGPCRFGYFGYMHQKILMDLGYRFEMIVLDPAKNFTGEINRLRLMSKKSWKDLIYALRLSWYKLNAIERLIQLTHQLRPRELKKGTAAALSARFIQEIDSAPRVEELKKINKKMTEAFMTIPYHSGYEPPRVGIVGDIYLLSEPFANANLEENLGILGVEVHRSIYLNDWVKMHLIGVEKTRQGRKIMCAAKPYLQDFVGGHGLETVGNTVLYAQQHYAGVIQLIPLTCMPEIIAHSILPVVSRNYKLPILNLVIDEHSTSTSLLTKLEAFVEMLKNSLVLKGHR